MCTVYNIYVWILYAWFEKSCLECRVRKPVDFSTIAGMKSTIDSNISAELVLKITLFFFCNIGMIFNICSVDKSSTLYAGSAFFLACIFDREEEL